MAWESIPCSNRHSNPVGEFHVLEVKDSVFHTSVILSLRTFRSATGASEMRYLLGRLNVFFGYKTGTSVLGLCGKSSEDHALLYPFRVRGSR